MKLGFDAKRLYCNFTGLGNYSRALVKNLQTLYPTHDYNLYTPKVKEDFVTDYFRTNAAFHTHQPDTSFKALWRSFGITKQLEQDSIELFHGLSNELPFNIHKSGVKSIVTIHDLIFKTLPKTYSAIDRTIYDVKFKASCHNADKIIAISESTKNDIVKFYGISPEKIDVIYQSCNPIFYEPHTAEAIDLSSLNLPDEYLLTVGSIEPRKNVKLILESYSALAPQHQLPLVLVGGVKNKTYKAALDQVIAKNGLADKIHWVTNLKDNRSLQQVYKNARALIYPSFFEGFGLPVVEGLLSKTPVITANISSLPEAGGPTTLYVDPNSSSDMANAITQLLSSSSLQADMITSGYEYAIDNFSPAVVTQKTAACYEKVVNG